MIVGLAPYTHVAWIASNLIRIGARTPHRVTEEKAYAAVRSAIRLLQIAQELVDDDAAVGAADDPPPVL